MPTLANDRRRLTIRIACIVLAAFAFGVAPLIAFPERSTAAEPPATSARLQLWLDAQQINAQRDSGGEASLKDGDALPQWPDASGNQRHLVQRDDAKQPRLMQLEDQWFVRFDGDDDHLGYVGAPESLASATIFLVAAPHHNPGDFRGLFAANEVGGRDFETGFNVDLGPGPSRSFNHVNVEGRGFGGARNLRTRDADFGTLHLIEVRIDGDARNVEVWIDGEREGSRPLEPGSRSIQQLTLGARCYTHGPGEQVPRGHAAVDIAELLIYGDVVPDEDAQRIRKHLLDKYQSLADQIPASIPGAIPDGVPLVKASNPPPIQMLVPGFTVRELPVQLKNINNVRFREDGKLVALGYNGDVHLLSDTDGDSLEDHAELFFQNEGNLRGPLGMVLTPPDDPRGRGLFVPSKGKVSFIVDTDGDDRADEEIVVADGWEEIAQNVDAVGIALDKEGNIYFGLGTANFANAYLIDGQGNAEYSLESDRGTVQKVSADFQQRETICTGVRFPIAFAFNEHGDLFCTDQEGATWLANGNPFDELLHIRPGLHYGFPPRHPRHNPGVHDEPSTFDYGPQHQSTCGMVFNLPQPADAPVFGPEWWRGDAIVCGESRGKIWRTALAKTAQGYVADTQLIACLQMLTVDACVAPNGDLVVACHSGPPDWGTGPAGEGKLFRIQMTRPEAPRPVAAWAETSDEVHITFDRPLDPLSLQGRLSEIGIEHGQYVRAGDRYENLVPPYAVVQQQQFAPRWKLGVQSVSISQDLHTLILRTDRMTHPHHYAVTLPGADAPPESTRIAPASTTGATETEPSESEDANAAIDVDFSLEGVRVEWTPAPASDLSAWSGWLPHLDIAASRELLAASASHQELWRRLQEPGQLTITTQVDVTDILRPAVQPGSSLDYQWPEEIVTLHLSGTPGLAVDVEGEHSSPASVRVEQDDATNTFRLTTQPNRKEPLNIRLQLETGAAAPLELHCWVTTNEDATPRPLPLRRFLLPWVDSNPSPTQRPEPAATEIPELAGGSWGRGHRLFHSDRVGCAKCHLAVDAEPTIGPDLGNLVHRDYASVLRDIEHPSHAINPDYISHQVILDDGRVLTGVLRTEKGALVLGDKDGNSIQLDRRQIERMQPSLVSVMPTGLLDGLTDAERRDLMTYLLSPPPRMPLDSPLEAPPVRTSAEVAAALSGADPLPKDLRPLNLVLVDGIKDHGPGEHDYPAWQRAWQQLFLADPTLTISTARDFPSDEQLAAADVVIFFQKGSFSGVRPAKLDAFLQRGGGAVYIHWAVNGDDRSAEFAKRIGLASRAGGIRFRHGPLDLEIHNPQHPIVRNFERLQLYDESYWELSGDPQSITLLATSLEDGQRTPQMWTTEHLGGRIFVSIPGHYSWTFDDPLFRILLLRGIAWTADEPVDRFNALVTPGARIAR